MKIHSTIFCPEGSDTWCKYRRVEAGIREYYARRRAIPKAVFEFVKPIYIQLAERKLLERCLMGATQNANESYNNNRVEHASEGRLLQF